jgi:hypothetical protein
MISRLVFVGTLAFFTAEVALACRPLRGYLPYEPESVPRSAAENSPSLEVGINRILRGTYSPPDAGYKFEVVEGGLVRKNEFSSSRLSKDRCDALPPIKWSQNDGQHPC